MWPFRRKPLLSAEAARWHLDNFAWLVSRHGQRSGFADARLVLPTLEFFDARGNDDHQLARQLFEQTKAHCGLAHADIQLAAVDHSALDARRLLGRPGSIAGTYGWSGGQEPRITYAPRLIRTPHALVATFAHELAHHLLKTGADRSPPIRSGQEEPLTDLTAIYLGFGLFLINGYEILEALPGGWSRKRLGYLTKQDRLFGLALFLAVKQLDPATAMQYLKADHAAMLARCLGEMDGHKAEIRALQHLCPATRKQTPGL